jgi:hypothetical protein
MDNTHVHDCTGHDATCACGFVFKVLPICVSIEISDGHKVLISDGFNCNSIDVAIAALEKSAKQLARLR